jgi:AraC family transcriptional regulator
MEFETAPFTNDLIYTHWACVEINEMNSFEKDLHVLKFNGGKYLKFTHKGLSTDFLKTSYEIYAHWVPFYGFKIENRPHFQIMDERYKSDRIDSEEDLYIPVL